MDVRFSKGKKSIGKTRFQLSMPSSDLISSDRNRRILRFLIAGGTGAGTNISLLYIFTAFFGWWYIASASLSFILAYVVSFYLQKFWVFTDHSRDKFGGQLAVYFMVAILNLLANNTILYALVEYAHVWYVLAQFYTSIIVAVWSFFAYGKLFKRQSNL